MPPKAARGRGRGRGSALRGRKAADQNSGAHHDPDPQFNTEPPSTPLIPSLSKIAGPQNVSEAVTPSPNSSPADVPTETPAPTPIRATTSQNNPGGPSGSSTPTTLISLNGGRGGAKESKFKPRAIRRDVGERAQAEEKEKARMEAFVAENARVEAEKARAGARMLRGRGGGATRAGRGRGDVMGRGVLLGRGGIMMGSAPSGLFGVAPAGLDRKNGLFVPMSGRKRDNGPSVSRTGGSGGSGGEGEVISGSSGTRIKTEGSSTANGDGTYLETSGPDVEGKEWIPDPQYPDEDPSAPRVDIELINLVSSESEDDDEPIITGINRVNKGKSRATTSKGGLKPVRLLRQEHKERVSQVNTEPTVKAEPNAAEDADMLTVDEQKSLRLPSREDEKFQGVYDNPDLTRIKHEDGAPYEEDPRFSIAMRSLSRDATPGARSEALPEFKKTIEHLGSSFTVTEGPSSPIQRKKIRTRRPSHRRDRKPVIQTDEDREEYERYLEDVAILANELGGMQTKGKDVDGDVVTDGGDVEQLDKKEGRLYLFQFPPVLPKLYNPLNKKEDPPEDTHIVSSSTRVDLTGEPTVAIKNEPTVEIVKKEDDLPPEPKKVKGPVVEEEGWVGKLIVRESGRVELSWGGTNMVLGRGVDIGFLNIGVVVEGGVVPGAEGKAIGMGKVMGKFVVVPDWETLT